MGGDVTAIGAGELLYSTGTTTYDSLVAGTSNYILKSNGAAAPSWVDPSTLGLGNYWQLADNALAPASLTNDLLVGGAATGTAKFRVESGTGNVTTLGTITANTTDTINGVDINAGTISGATWQGTAISNIYGGTGQNSSGWTGIPYVSAGTWGVDTNYLSVARGGLG